MNINNKLKVIACALLMGSSSMVTLAEGPEQNLWKNLFEEYKVELFTAAKSAYKQSSCVITETLGALPKVIGGVRKNMFGIVILCGLGYGIYKYFTHKKPASKS